MSEHARQHHLGITPRDMTGNKGLGRYVLLPGSSGRARLISEMFDEVEREIVTPRHLDTFLGRIKCPNSGDVIDVAAVTSGMGTGSIEIVTSELLHCGVRRMVRVGTSGAVRWREVALGSFVIATGAVRDDATSDHYAPKSYPAVAHPDVVQSYVQAARRMGIADRTFRGVIQTKASLYARAEYAGPLAEDHERFHEIMMRAGVLSSEMESSTLFTMASTLCPTVLSLTGEQQNPEKVHKTGTVLGIIGSKEGWCSDNEILDIEEQTCRWGLEGIRDLFRMDHPTEAAPFPLQRSSRRPKDDE